MTADEREILDLSMQFLAAWDRGDARGAVAHMAEDAIRVGAFGDVGRGRAEIEAAYRKLFAGPMKGAHARWDPSVRLLSGDVAVADGPLTIEPAGGAPLRGYALDIWKKTGGRWRLIEAHPRLFPPQPAGK